MRRLLILIFAAVALYSCSEKKKTYDGKQMSVSSAMGSADTTGFEKAI